MGPIFVTFSEYPNFDKAESLQEGIFFLIHLFARDMLEIKKN